MIMKEKMTKKGPPNGGPGKKEKEFHPSLLEKLNEAGLDTRNLIFSLEGDMDFEQCFKSSWLCFDDKGLYIALGDEKLDKVKKHHTPVAPVFRIDEIRSIPIDEIDSLETESYLSTGRLISVKDGVKEPLIWFTLGKLPDFSRFVRAFNSYKETGTADIKEDDKHEGKCKVCGEPCPPGKDFCRRHRRTSGTAIRLIKFFGGHVPQIALIILAMVASAAAAVFVPQISTRSLYDNVLSNPDGLPQAEVLKALGVLVLSIVGLRLLNVVLTMIQQYMSASIMPRVMYDVKVKIFEAMQRLSVSYYSSKQTGSLMDRVMRDANNIYWFFTDGIPRVIIDGATIIGVVAIMIKMNWRLSLVALIATPFLVASLFFGDKAFRRMHHKVWVFRARTGSMLSDNINGQRVIKAFAKEDDEYDHFSASSKNLRDAEVHLAVTEATLFPILEIVVMLLSIVVLGYGGVMVARGDGSMTAGTLLSFIVYLEMLKEPFGFMAWVTNWWSRCADSATRVFEICDAQPEITEKENAVPLDNIRGDVVIKELDFEYEPARPVIKKLSLEVKAGDMLGIVGKTGAGKTTIANLISRLYDAKDGSVSIDGTDVRDLKLGDLRKNIGLVSQDIYLFIGSIADNIRYAKPDASMSEVIAAAKAACAHEYIMKLPDAYETRIGAGGQRLSGGEKQRISIARTIIQNPKILILDEATAAMDTETERNIQQSLQKLTKGRTTIAIAHRLSTLRDSDYLAVIDQGTIVEYGTFNELIRQKGEFYRQYKIQTEALKTIGIGDDAETNSAKEEQKDEHESE